MRLELRDITKRFPGVLANDAISISADRGKVLGLLGENGAGKTTLMNILSGPVQAGLGPDLHRRPGAGLRGSGRGHPGRRRHGPPALHARPGVRRRSRRSRSAPRPSRNRFGTLRPGGGPQADRRAVRPVQASASTPTPGSRTCRSACASGWRSSRRSIARATSSSSTSPAPCSRRSRPRSCSGSSGPSPATGTTIIFITHKLNEVLEVADDIVVLRRGRVAGTADPKDDTRQELANLMVGRDVELIVPKGPAQPGEVVLEPARTLHVRDDRLRARGERRRPRCPGRRDRGHRRRPGQRPDRAGRGDRRAALVRRRRGDDRRPPHREGLAAAGRGPGRRAHPRGSRPGRPDRHDDRRRELHPRHLPPRAVQPRGHPRPRGDQRAGRDRASRSSTSGRRRSRPMRARSRAATSRRSSSRASSRCR